MYKNSNPNSISLMQRERLENSYTPDADVPQNCDICLATLSNTKYCVVKDTVICASCVAKIIEHQIKTVLPKLNPQIKDIAEFALKEKIIKQLIEEVL